MNGRFENLYRLEDNLYKLGSPVIVSAATLLKDTETDSIIAQFKFQSVSNVLIKALKISINTYDVSGEELTKIEEYQYLDLNVQNGEYFGSRKAIVIPDKVTRSIGIDKLLVVYENGESYRISGEELLPLEKPKKLSSVFDDADMIQQYQLDVSNQGIYFPECIGDLWYCICGKLNNTDVCTACGSHKEKLFNAYDLDTLRKHFDIRIEAERIERVKQQEKYQDDIYLEAVGLMASNQLSDIEQAIQKFETLLDWKDSQEKILECKSKIEQLKLEEKNKAKRIKKVSIIAVFSIVVVITIGFIVINVYVPYSKYNRAKKAMETEQYEDAIPILEDLGDYKNSKKYLQEAKYYNALRFVEDMRYSDAYFLFKEIKGYKDVNLLLKNFVALPSRKKTIEHDGETIYEEFTYDSEGKCIKSTEEYLGGDEYEKYTTEYTYDSRSNCVKTVERDFDGNQWTYEYDYDSANHLIQERKITDWNSKSSLKDNVIYTDYNYDGNGKCIKKVITYSPTSQIVYEWIYNSEGMCVKEIYTSSTLNTVTEYFYDAEGMCVKEIYTSSTSNTVTEYFYNAEKMLIKTVSTAFGSSETTEYFYDSNGNCIKEISGPKDFWEYTYNDYNDPIKEVRTHSGGTFIEEYQYEDYQIFYVPKQ